MHFSNEKLIYQIPIYSMPKKEFEHRWDKWKNKWYKRSRQMGNSIEEADQVITNVMQLQYPRNVWEYNQIVGFVEIFINSTDIVFNIQKTLDTRIRAVGKTKHYIQNMKTNGMHFPITNMANEEIVTEIDSYLDSIEKDLTRPFCLNRDTYNNLKNHIDFNGVKEQDT